MAVPGKRQPPQVSSVVAFAHGTGLRQQPLLPTQPAPPPISQSAYAVGSDSVAFSVEAGQTITLTFPNLPSRSIANPRSLPVAPGQVSPAPLATLHFAVTLADCEGPPPIVKGIAIDSRFVRYPGPFLGGGATYRLFQAQITGGSAAASGNVTGALTLTVAGNG